MTDITELTTERTTSHGDFRVHALTTQLLKQVMKNSYNWQHGHLTEMHKEALEMIAHKIGRILSGNPNFRDHWDDIGGYSKITADRLTQDVR